MAFSSDRSLSTRALARAALLPALPTLLRLCVNENRSVAGLIEKVARDVAALAPELAPLAETWARAVREPPDLTRSYIVVARTDLVVALDRRAAERNDSVLRDLTAIVLAVSTAPSDASVCARLGAQAWREIDELWRVDARVRQLGASAELWRYDVSESADLDPDEPEIDPEPIDDPARQKASLAEAAVDLRADARAVALALSALSLGTADPSFARSMCESVLSLGRELVRPLEARSASRERALMEEKERRRAEDAAAREKRRAEAATAKASAGFEPVDLHTVPAGHIIVCPAVAETGYDRSRSAVRGYEHIIGKPVPLIATPDLTSVRANLAFEFPYALDLIDRVLADLVGRPTIRLSPMVLAGRPGCGKSRFARRLSGALGVGLWRVDGARDTGASIAGLDRRWHSAEPAHPFMAVARYGHANPAVLVDELDKAPTRVDYGRLWDGLLALLEPENASRFSDPCLQVPIDLSQVSYIATANRTDSLPAPLLDRLRVLAFPVPQASHLEALLPAIIADHVRERGLDPRWIEPISGNEIDLLRKAWSGGSLRRLCRLTDTILQARETSPSRH